MSARQMACANNLSLKMRKKERKEKTIFQEQKNKRTKEHKNTRTEEPKNRRTEEQKNRRTEEKRKTKNEKRKKEKREKREEKERERERKKKDRMKEMRIENWFLKTPLPVARFRIKILIHPIFSVKVQV